MLVMDAVKKNTEKIASDLHDGGRTVTSMDSLCTSLIVTGGVVIGVKMWHDILHLMYHRERMRVCKTLLTEGASLVRLAIERGCVSDFAEHRSHIPWHDFAEKFMHAGGMRH